MDAAERYTAFALENHISGVWTSEGHSSDDGADLFSLMSAAGALRHSSRVIAVIIPELILFFTVCICCVIAFIVPIFFLFVCFFVTFLIYTSFVFHFLLPPEITVSALLGLWLHSAYSMTVPDGMVVRLGITTMPSTTINLGSWGNSLSPL